MSIKINLGAWNSVFAVPSQIVDEGLKFSDGVKLKVLLYVLRNSGNEIDNKMISDATGVNVTDVPEALDYWVSLGILQKTNDEYRPEEISEEEKSENIIPADSSDRQDENQIKNSKFSDNSSAEIVKNVKGTEKNSEDTAQKPESSEKPHFTVGRPQKPDYVFTAQRLAVDEELKLLVNESQLALGKALSNSDISTLLMLKDTCGLPIDVILMLIQYCISIDKGNMRAVEKIGVQWADEGISSVEAADNKIRLTKQSSKNFSVVSAAFGLKNVGSPTKKQLEYGDKWVGNWRFSPEMLREAYERCVDTKGTMNFRYIDGILKRWNSNGIKNKEDLQKFESSSSKNNGFRQKSSFDVDELEKIDTLDNI